MADNQAFSPIQGLSLKLSDLQQEGLPVLNQYLTQMTNRVNALLGQAGSVKLSAPIDMGNHPITNLGKPVSPTDAVSKIHADSHYGPSIISRALEAKGSHPLKSARYLNNNTQQENFSTFLNGMFNTAPTPNSSQVSFGVPSGGSVQCTISAGFTKCVDGKTVIAYGMRQDTLTLPIEVSLISLSRVAGVVTAQSAAPHGFSLDQNIYIASGDQSFPGTFPIASIPDSTHFTYLQTAPDDPISLNVSLSRSSHLVTATTAVAHGYYTGQSVAINAGDASFNGTFTITVTGPFTYTYSQVAADATTTGTSLATVTGSASLGSVYYYSLNRDNNALSIVGPYTADTPDNRIAANIDGTVQVAVAVLTSTGGSATESGAGATPATLTGGHVIIGGRLA